MATVAASRPVDVVRAAAKANEAFASWSPSSPADRHDVSLKAVAVVDGKAQKLAATMTSEKGGTFGWGMFNADLAANILREAAAAVTYPLGRFSPPIPREHCHWRSANRAGS